MRETVARAGVARAAAAAAARAKCFAIECAALNLYSVHVSPHGARADPSWEWREVTRERETVQRHFKTKSAAFIYFFMGGTFLETKCL